MTDEDASPHEAVELKASASTGLVIRWADGHESSWGLVEIRRACPCALCDDARARGEPVWPGPRAPELLDVTDALVVGSYAVRFTWNDGHSTGIYRWVELRGACPCAECSAARR